MPPPGTYIYQVAGPLTASVRACALRQGAGESAWAQAVLAIESDNYRTTSSDFAFGHLSNSSGKDAIIKTDTHLVTVISLFFRLEKPYI